ncbi:MAG: J domain-containing protein [Chlorobiaceae bacterium]|nr:J domain-containing protein [Chlorobiaceae bacterium]
MMTKIQTHYDNLGVSRNAPEEVIKAAYRTMSKIHHPDLNPDSPESIKRMKSINESYDILHNPLKRKLYDEWLRQQDVQVGKKSEAPPQKPSWQPSQPIRHKKRPISFRGGFILTTGTIFFTLIFAIALYDPLLQFISDYGVSGLKTVPQSANPPSAITPISEMDTETTVIPRLFIGDDMAGLFSRELKSFPPKDEFEKLTDYKTRFKSSVYHRQYFFTSTFGKVSSYDIERQLISISFTDNNWVGETLPVIVDSRKSAFPADSNTRSIPEITNYYLKDIRKDAGISRYLTSALNFRISPSEGRELKKHLGILIIATPEVSSDGQAVSENHANEYEIFYQLNRKITNRYIHSLINAVWVYNTETGTVHFKKNFPESFAKEYYSWLRDNQAAEGKKTEKLQRENPANEMTPLPANADRNETIEAEGINTASRKITTGQRKP